jgi:hypothetical protein
MPPFNPTLPHWLELPYRIYKFSHCSDKGSTVAVHILRRLQKRIEERFIGLHPMLREAWFILAHLLNSFHYHAYTVTLPPEDYI